VSEGRLDADVVIVGSGVAGALMAHRLAQAGLKVLILEAGPEVTRAELHAKFARTRTYTPVDLDPRVDHAPTTDPRQLDSYLINVGSAKYNVMMTKAVGGTTWHWGGAARRFYDDDFRLNSAFGVAVDWPLRYAELETYYCEAEQLIGVTAPSHDDEAARRSRPAPMRDFVWPHFYRRLQEILRPHGLEVETLAYARNAQDYQSRPACRGNNTCWPLCPIGAQYSAIVHVDAARALGVEVRSDALAVRLDAGSDRSIGSVVIRRPDGSLQTVTGRYFVVAANGVETPKLLLASRSGRAPNGIANSSNQVGRNFMDHAVLLTRVLSRAALYPGRGPAVFGQLRGLDTGSYRRERAATSMSIENRMSVDEIAGEVLRAGFKGDDCDREVRFRAARTFMMFSEVEMLPRPGNRLSLDWDQQDSAGQPRIRVNLDLDDYTRRSLALMADMHRDLCSKIGTIEATTISDAAFGNHPAGAARMGHDPGASVVDAQCRSHDHRNLFLAGSSVFPTLGGARAPTLTIAALALRTADAIMAQAKGR